MYVGSAVLVLVAVCAVCAGASYALIYSADASHPGTEEAIGGDGEEASSFEESYPAHPSDHGAFDTTPETSTASTVTKGVTTATTSSSSRAPTTTETQRAPTTQPAPTTQRPFFIRWPLLCTLGSRAVLRDLYPPDGLCDFIFYTHVFLDEKTGEILSATEGSLEEFFAMAGAANRTNYGISFSTDHLTNLPTALGKDSTRKALSALFEDFVEHYGILEVRGAGPQLDNVMKGVLDTLHELKKLRMQASPRTPDGRTYRAVGLELTSHPQEVSRLPTLLSSAAEAGANLLIIRTHVSMWDMEEDRGTAGATMLHNPRGIQQPDMNTTLDHLRPQSYRESILMMSFTMGVAAFTMPMEWTNVTDRGTEHGKPTNFSTVDYSETCSGMNADGVRVHPEAFVVGVNSDEHYQLIYEDETTLSKKITYTHEYLKARHEASHFGWALFDVDREDYNDTCGAGKSFARLKAARRAVSSFGPR